MHMFLPITILLATSTLGPRPAYLAALPSHHLMSMSAPHLGTLHAELSAPWDAQARNSVILYPLLKPLFLMVLLPDSMLPLLYPQPPPPAIQSLVTSVVKRLNEVKFSVAAVGACRVILGHQARGESWGPGLIPQTQFPHP